MKLSISLFCVFLLFVSCEEKQTTSTDSPESALIKRIAPNHASQFIIEIDKISEEEDWFEIESKNDKIILRGNNGVSIASAFYYYLKEYTNSQITWNGTNLNLPKKLPALKTLVHKKTPYEYRYYLNYCTFNYTMSWWDWERWEKEIDWMALHGINMPLAITGEEYIWDEVYKSYGFTDANLSTFFSGPAYFSWFWMGNLDGWGGPLSQHWKDTHRDLQIKILKRERALGMKPVLPAFTGHVPASFKTFFPEANLKQTNWGNDFSDTYILDANDPLFAEIGKKFLETQERIYGTDHLYSADTFNENTPPSNDPEYLSNLSSKVYEGMKSADPDAVWVMQGWLFYSHRDFWQAPQIKGLLAPVPDDKMIILDLASEIEPVWKRTEAFYGKQWIWNMLHSFGGNISMFGRIETVASEPAKALNDAHAGKLKGIGLTMESIEQNPVLYELMTDNTWRDTPIDLSTWLERYTLNRYGQSNTDILKAWDVMVKTVYNGQVIRDGAESIIVARPTFEGYRRWARTKLNYAPEDLLPAWNLFVKTIPLNKDSDGFEYDLVDLTRQVLANYALPLQQQITTAYKANNKADFDKYSNEFIALIDDMDMLLGTRKDFLLGPWIADARSWGQTEQEKALYEQNARDLITLWGDANNRLHEYSNRQWSGLFSDFYKPRWEQFFATVKKDWKHFDQNAFDETIKQWEWNWVTDRKDFPIDAQGNARVVVKELYDKYRSRIVTLTAKMQPIQYNY
ncbi:alpha-N-acetylglucosaminidase [Mariniflexile litorale]|uniref:Alpha-N-acetylglucosaminidase n=1 Tax=Mariniflexile litorale TaxID=3045158 RepID=A0AAU7EGV1_9FLAO|nr:alpha-N-acetylglucosaminidase [Mariniflexile sp. KMM 9835]MDQ8210878.1 alpha-N-acetylglucosaminidase [Mariniflexile sp. KMM 9835]